LRKKREDIKIRLLKNKEGLKSGDLLDKEIKLFLKLGDSYLSDDYQEYYKAAAIYQYVRKVLNNKVKAKIVLENDVRIKQVGKRIGNTEKKFLEVVGKGENISRIKSIEPRQEKLEILRKEVKERLEKLKFDGITRAEEVRNIYEEIRKKLIGNDGVATNLINDCISQLGSVPLVNGRNVQYCIVGMGSMSLTTITPWSDLEHFILIESGLEEKNGKRNKEIFQGVSVFIVFKDCKLW